MLSEQCVRDSWEIERESMRRLLLAEKKFNPKSVDRAVENFIESMAFARIPCPSHGGICAAWNRFNSENCKR